MRSMIGEYQQITPFQTAGSGSAKWCIATRMGQRFFVKQFLSPVFPKTTTNKMLYQKQQERCVLFETKKQRLYHAMGCVLGDVLVPVIDFFCYQGHYFAISEEVPTSQMTIENTRHLSAKHRRNILLSLALGLQRLHLQGIVHADLKPENALLTLENDTFDVRLIDVDSGFLLEDPPKDENELQGDPAYLAPEAFLCMAGAGDHQLLTEKIDTFAFGLIIHFVWTGEWIGFDQSKYHYPFEVVLDQGNLVMSESLPEVHRSLVASMLQLDPKQRPSDAKLIKHLSSTSTDAGSHRQRLAPINGMSRFMKR